MMKLAPMNMEELTAKASPMVLSDTPAVSSGRGPLVLGELDRDAPSGCSINRRSPHTKASPICDDRGRCVTQLQTGQRCCGDTCDRGTLFCMMCAAKLTDPPSWLLMHSCLQCT